MGCEVGRKDREALQSLNSQFVRCVDMPPPIVGWGLEQPNRPTISGARREAQVHVNRRNEVGMSQKFLDYLNREHARLEQEIEVLMKRRLPDEIGIARLKKLKLAVKDQIAHIQSDEYPALVA